MSSHQSPDDSPPTPDELDLLRAHISQLAQIVSIAASSAQFYFQLERLWFYHFDQKPYKLGHWCRETFSKTLRPSEMHAACLTLEAAAGELSSGGRRPDSLLESASLMLEDVSFWVHDLDIHDPEAAYKRIWTSEKNAKETLAQALALFRDIEASPQSHTEPG